MRLLLSFSMLMSKLVQISVDSMPRILLCDNGSKVPAATLRLRTLATKLIRLSGYQVEPVSLQHAGSIPDNELDGRPADVLPAFLEHCLEQGERDFLLLPLFFGKSRALTSFVPEQQALLEDQYGPFMLDVADVLYPLPAGDAMLVKLMLDNIRSTLASPDQVQKVVLVDHGSPLAKVTAVRQHIAEQLAEQLSGQMTVEQAVMERRPGKEYDFNGPLLSDWLDEQAHSGVESVLVSLLFLLPGRHAGAGGDIETICADAMTRYPGLKIHVTPLIAENDILVKLLHQRLKSVWQDR